MVAEGRIDFILLSCLLDPLLGNVFIGVCLVVCPQSASWLLV